MNKHSLTDFLIAHVNIDRETIAETVGKQKKMSVAKGEYLLMVGEICRNAFFVEQGLLRAITPLTQKARNTFYNLRRKIG
jgi:hypothetical protein